MADTIERNLFAGFSKRIALRTEGAPSWKSSGNAVKTLEFHQSGQGLFVTLGEYPDYGDGNNRETMAQFDKDACLALRDFLNELFPTEAGS